MTQRVPDQVVQYSASGSNRGVGAIVGTLSPGEVALIDDAGGSAMVTVIGRTGVGTVALQRGSGVVTVSPSTPCRPVR